MYDDPGDIDGNGIPDSLQFDPVLVTEPGMRFGEPPEAGLPGITAPVYPETEAAETADIDPVGMVEVQHEAQQFGFLTEATGQVLKDIGDSLSTVARKE